MRHALFCLLALAFTAAGLAGQGLSVTAAFDPPVMAVGEPAAYVVTVTAPLGTNLPQSAPPAPPNANALGLAYAGASTSSQVQIINGRQTGSQTVTHTFRFLPRQVGPVTVPAYALDLGGQRLAIPAAAGEVRAGADGSDAPALLLDFDWPETPVFTGQTVELRLRLLVASGTGIRLLQRGKVEFAGAGFSAIKEAGEPTQGNATVDGRAYAFVAFPLTLTALAAGTQEAQFRLPVLVEVPERRSRSSLFDRFGNFPGFGQQQQVTLSTEPQQVSVRPLPEPVPPDFCGGIGQFELELAGWPAKGQVGRPIELKLSLTGQGNFDRITAPTPDFDGWRAFPPKAEFAPAPDQAAGHAGTLALTYTLIPLREARELPSLTMSVLEPASGRYRRLAVGSRPVEILPAALGQGLPPTPSAGPAAPAGAPAPAAPPAAVWADLEKLPGPRAAFAAPGRAPLGDPAFWLAQLGPLALLTAALLLRARAESRRRDRYHGLRTQARRTSTEALALARAVAAKGETKPFYEAAARALRAAAGEALARPPESLVWSEIEPLCAAHPGARELLETADALHYAPMARSVGELGDAAETLARLVREIREVRP